MSDSSEITYEQAKAMEQALDRAFNLGFSREDEEPFRQFVRGMSDYLVRALCYSMRLGGFNMPTSVIFEELERRGGLCNQFRKHFSHKIADMINSRMAGVRVCYAPRKDGSCPMPMELDEDFMRVFGLEFKVAVNGEYDV